MAVERGLAQTFNTGYGGDAWPIVLPDYAISWPAVKTWSSETLRLRCGSARVLVEIGGLLSSNFRRASVTLSQYLDAIEAGQDMPVYVANQKFEGTLGQLLVDIEPGKSLWGSGGAAPRLWVGPIGSCSPAHYDERDNWFVQIAGTKQFGLCGPLTPGLYPYQAESIRRRFSRVDVSAPSPELHPDYDAGSWTLVELGPGDVLRIPRNWWHFAKSVTMTIGVNVFCD